MKAGVRGQAWYSGDLWLSHPQGLQQEEPWSGSGDLASSSVSVTYKPGNRRRVGGFHVLSVTRGEN